MAGRLAGKVALITGTAGGQGRAAALLFAREGARIVGCDLKAAENDETARMVRDAGGEMLAHAPVDLGDETQAREWIDAAATAFGGCDILYNNASAPRFAPFGEMSSDDWRFTMRNELDLVFYACRYAWPHLVQRGGGVIINTASRVALVGTEGAGDAAHAAAKGAVVALTRQLAAEGAPYGIRVNAISPGVIDSPANAEVFKIPQIRASAARLAMLNQIGTPEDVAYCALYLASDEAQFMTGANIVIDGGSTIRNTLMG